MDAELLSPELDLNSEKDEITENIQNEIECPRCSDTMILSLDFDRFLFFCQKCKLSLLIK
jgi:ribosomal protein S27AE